MKPDNTKRGIPAQTMIRLPDVIKRVGLGKTAIYDHIKNGDFPKPAKFGRCRNRMVRYRSTTRYQNNRPTLLSLPNLLVQTRHYYGNPGINILNAILPAIRLTLHQLSALLAQMAYLVLRVVASTDQIG